MRRQYHQVDESSGVGVLDKAVAVLRAVGDEPCSLASLVQATGLTRPTAHRLALALEHHRLVDRDGDGRFVLGSQVAQWAASLDPWRTKAQDTVTELRDRTGESAQVYRRAGQSRVCIAAAEPASGLHDTVPLGASLTMKAGSAAQVLAAWLEPHDRAVVLQGAAYTERDLARVRQRGWAQSLGQREPGVASISAPVRDDRGTVLAAISISGPIERLARPSADQRTSLLSAAQELGIALTRH